MLRARTVLLLSLGLITPACATRKQVKSLPSDAGVAATYTAPFDKAKLAAGDSLGELSFTVQEEGIFGRHDWRILASQGLASGTLGRIARVILQDKSGEVVVRVVVESKLETDAATQADRALAEDIQRKIAGRLK